LLEFDMRLGEGSGAVAALPLLTASAKLLAEMATFDSAGISGKAEETPVEVAEDTEDAEPPADPA
jgi:nicotinate-nucleotide--dimethylbenzimidazole phosphoribosyltransferase